MIVRVTVSLGVWTESVETGALHKSAVLVAYQPSSYGAPLQVFSLVRGSVQEARLLSAALGWTVAFNNLDFSMRRLFILMGFFLVESALGLGNWT